VRRAAMVRGRSVKVVGLIVNGRVFRKGNGRTRLG
jgi:hypothetical protein